jgi:hypothetical protein
LRDLTGILVVKNECKHHLKAADADASNRAGGSYGRPHKLEPYWDQGYDSKGDKENVQPGSSEMRLDKPARDKERWRSVAEHGS